MKVKIGQTIYDSNKEPIMIILAPEDKANIANMHPDHFIYCSYPEGMEEEKVKEWMQNR
jgi:hypothetical protein